MKAYVFTDIVNSTGLKQEMPGFGFGEKNQNFVDQILKPHRDRLEENLAAQGGTLVNLIGDGCFLVFRHPFRAAMWAISVQESHQNEPILDPAGKPVGVKISIHWGDASRDPNSSTNFIGRSVDYAARLVDFGRTGQVLISETVYVMLREAGLQQADYAFHNHGERELRGIGQAQIFELLWNGKEFGPLKGDDGLASIDSAKAETEDHAVAGGSVGGYRLKKKIGQGGMGTVFLGHDATMDRECVIKVINDRFLQPGHEELVERFFNEIRTVAGLKHSNIVQAYHASSRTAQTPFLVLEYVSGVGVDDLIRENRIHHISDACEIVAQTAKALAYINKKGLVHRDIKPSNLMLAHDEEGGSIVKVLDLGLALLVDDTDQNRITSMRERAMGTAYYMPPEQWVTTNVDIRADIYALGCTLYHMLAGFAPFEHSEFSQKIAHERELPPTLPAELNCPPGLWAIIQKMLAKDVTQRYQDPAEVVEAIAAFREGSHLLSLLNGAEQVEVNSVVDHASATRSTVAQHPRKVPRGKPSNKKKVWGGVASALLLTVILGAGWYFMRPPSDVVTPPSPDHVEHVLEDPQLRDLAAAMVLTDPGEMGEWWFDEHPWFAPPVRMYVLEHLTPEKYAAIQSKLEATNAIGAYVDLMDVADDLGRDPDQTALRSLFQKLEQSKRWRAFNEQSRADVAKDWASLVAEILDGKALADVLANRKELSAETWHVLGLALAMEATAEKDQFPQAEKAFRHAISAYSARVLELRKKSDPKAESQALQAECLKSLCEADFAQAYLKQGPSYRGDAITQFTAARSTLQEDRTMKPSDQTPPGTERFYVWLGANLAVTRTLESRTQTPKEQFEPLETAWKVARDMPPEDSAAVLLKESYARYYLENDDFKKAAEYAKEAKAVRQQQSFARGRVNPSALSFYLRDMQLLALTEHFNGNSANAASDVAQLFEKEFERIREAAELTPDQKREVEAQRPNQLGRWADMLFYGTGQLEPAQGKMAEAIESATGLFDDKPQHLAYMRFKMTLFLTLGGKNDQYQAKSYYAPAIAAYKQWVEDSDSPDPQVSKRGNDYVQRNRLFCQAATAAFAPAELAVQFPADYTPVTTRVEALYQFVKENYVADNRADGFDRDQRQLLLFTSYYLQNAPDLPAGNKLDQIIAELKTHRGKEVFLPNYINNLKRSAQDAARATASQSADDA